LPRRLLRRQVVQVRAANIEALRARGSRIDLELEPEVLVAGRVGARLVVDDRQAVRPSTLAVEDDIRAPGEESLRQMQLAKVSREKA
jgi:hypothetical protein